MDTVPFNRPHFIRQLSQKASWDMIVIGGGATGLGIAVDAASRGYATLLLEGEDFAKGTSSRSTKLIHGGVRYLAQGNFPLVYEALYERGVLIKNAPHLVKKQSFVIPCYTLWERIKYLAGLKLYDWLSGRLSLGSSRYIPAGAVKKLLPNINAGRLRGGVEYFDAQFDDARLALNLAQTCGSSGGVALNYCTVKSLLKDGSGKITGVLATDREEGKEYALQAKVVINASGVFVDDMLRLDEPGAPPLIRLSQGTHIVLEKGFLGGGSALLVPRTADGRVVFAVPWQGYLLAGTTDMPVAEHSIEPLALPEEIAFILDTIRPYLEHPPQKKDILSVFAGLRPLAHPQSGQRTKNISREHRLIVGASGMVTITGGKWTTYRRMAEETVNAAIQAGGLPFRKCVTKSLEIHGFTTGLPEDHLSVYGSDAIGVKALMQENPLLQKRLVEGMPYTEAEVLWAARCEMARTVEDVLARRVRILFLDARAAMEAAPRVAAILRKELDRDEEWEREQLNVFTALAHNYKPG